MGTQSCCCMKRSVRRHIDALLSYVFSQYSRQSDGFTGVTNFDHLVRLPKRLGKTPYVMRHRGRALHHL